MVILAAVEEVSQPSSMMALQLEILVKERKQHDIINWMAGPRTETISTLKIVI